MGDFQSGFRNISMIFLYTQGVEEAETIDIASPGIENSFMWLVVKNKIHYERIGIPKSGYNRRKFRHRKKYRPDFF
jgi:hypothetical protein